MPQYNRRDFLASSAIAATSSLFAPRFSCSAEPSVRYRLPVAAVVTVYFQQSHSDVLVGKILEGWQQDGGDGPALELVSLYVDQPDYVYEKKGAGDISREMARKHGFRLAKTIDEAITLGTDRVQVAGVISIGEHGDYPLTPNTGQQMYPRRRFFEEIVAAMQRGGKAVPVFNDKHLAYRWDDAKFMYDTARARKIPLLAGSSVPLAWRFPPLELPREAEIESVVTVGYDELERYGFHALEAHLAMIERRKGGEAGIVSVQALRGDEIHRAADEGRWPVDLFHTALATLPGKPHDADWPSRPEATLFLLEHRDGLKSAVALIGDLAEEFAFAARLKGQNKPVATWIRLQNEPPFGHFAQLLRAIEATIHTENAAYPVERTLLTTGILDRVMHSVAKKGKLFRTPELAIAYQPADWPYANHPQTRLKLPDLD